MSEMEKQVLESRVFNPQHILLLAFTDLSYRYLGDICKISNFRMSLSLLQFSTLIPLPIIAVHLLVAQDSFIDGAGQSIGGPGQFYWWPRTVLLVAQGTPYYILHTTTHTGLCELSFNYESRENHHRSNKNPNSRHWG